MQKKPAPPRKRPKPCGPRIVFLLHEMTGNIVKVGDMDSRPLALHNLLVTGQVTAYKFYPGELEYISELIVDQFLGDPHYATSLSQNLDQLPGGRSVTASAKIHQLQQVKMKSYLTMLTVPC